MTDRLLQVEAVHKSFVSKHNLFGRPVAFVDAVKDVSLEVGHGETLALVGESGAGKSTVGRMVLNLIPPDRGSIFVEGQELPRLRGRALRAARARARMIFQDPFSSLDPTMTISQTLSEALAIHRIGAPRRRRDRVAELLERVGMSTDHLDRFPYEFSGGQLQRVAIARALVTDPALIVCDEPVAALDMSIRAQIINLLRSLQEETAMGYLFITHDLSLVTYFADRVAVMYRGRIVESGPTLEVFEEPKHPYTQTLLAAVPQISPRARRSRGSARAPAPTADIQQDLTGCDYADRCPLVEPECVDARPETTHHGHRSVTCHVAAAGETDSPLQSGRSALADSNAAAPIIADEPEHEWTTGKRQ